MSKKEFKWPELNEKDTKFYRSKYPMIDEYLLSLIAYLRKHRPTVYTVLRHVNTSGMYRRIDVYMIQDNKPVYLTGLCAKLGIGKLKQGEDGIGISGCGMDMGFEIVYQLGRKIFPQGFKYRQGESHRNGDPSSVDKDGGYSLRREWL